MKHLKNMNSFLNENSDENPQRFEYMMLSRLQSDCEYFLGFGRGSERNLFHDNVPEHIAEMKRLWDVLVEKPQWLSFEDILSYEEKMLNYNN